MAIARFATHPVGRENGSQSKMGMDLREARAVPTSRLVVGPVGGEPALRTP